ncbi:MAG: glutaminyl-peptide cyclotransferase [Planctomycetota bacterium]
MSSIRQKRVWLVLALGALVTMAAWVVLGDEDYPMDRFEVVKVYPHDPKAYCQGLIFADGSLYEGTGQYGESSLRQVELETGKILRKIELPERYFGEGITAWGDHLIQLTWREEKAFVYDRKSLRKLREHEYVGEGWGLTHDGQHLIMSTGTSTLRFLDPETFKVVRRLPVRSRGAPLEGLNELEYVRGEIYANVFQTDFIVRISPESGKVIGIIDLAGLLPAELKTPSVDVLNGIAYDAASDRLFVTGKNWPRLFEIRLQR